MTTFGGKQKGSRKYGAAETELFEEYGGFYDVASFKAELGDVQATDDEIRQLIKDDRVNIVNSSPEVQHLINDERAEMAAQVKNAQRQANEADQQAREAKREAQQAKQKQDVEVRYKVDLAPSYGVLGPSYSDLAYERNRRHLAEAALYPGYSALSTAKFIEKEKLKDEIKREMAEKKERKPRVIVKVVKVAAKKKPAKKTTKKPAKKKAATRK